MLRHHTVKAKAKVTCQLQYPDIPSAQPTNATSQVPSCESLALLLRNHIGNMLLILGEG